MAYLQMGKNPFKELVTEEDYKSLASACYKHAEMFYRLCYRCRDMLLSEEMDAVNTNIAFACELYFKCLLFEYQIDCRKEHDLYKLYKNMPEHTELPNKGNPNNYLKSLALDGKPVADFDGAVTTYNYYTSNTSVNVSGVTVSDKAK